MNPCRDFERDWQSYLDGEPEGSSPGDQPAWAAHLAACAVCHGVNWRFRVLEASLDAQTAAASSASAVLIPGLADRVIAAWREPVPVRSAGRGSAMMRVAPWALAASLMLASGLMLGRFWPRASDDAGAADPVSVADDGVRVRPLSESVAEVSAASVGLARATSDSAGRLGQQLIGSVLPDQPEMVEPVVEPTRLIRNVGERLDHGMRPIARSARRAFDFMLPSGVRTARSTPRGA